MYLSAITVCACVLTAALNLSATVAQAGPGGSSNVGSLVPLRELWRKRLSLNNPTNVVVGRIEGRACLCVPGTDTTAGHGAAVEMLDAQGRVLWQHTQQSARSAGAYLQWIGRGGGMEPCVVYSFVPAAGDQPGGARLLRARDGVPINEIRNVTHFGNNNSIVADLDGDGRQEFIYADQKTLTCYDLPACHPRWRFDQGVLFCWSLPTLVDIDRNGHPEIVFGSEYNNGPGNSSMIALDAHGKQLWRHDGYTEDLGSTPVFVADADGDGVEELLKVGLDLEHRQKQRWNHLYVFDLRGRLKAKIELGFTGIAIGDLDQDQHLEGVGLTNTRDGGSAGQRQVRCVDLVTGRVDWTVPVRRAYLDTNSPVMADLNGDGRMEAVVGTGNPAGYGRLPGSQPWGDLYVVRGRDKMAPAAEGMVLQHVALPGFPVNMALCDINDDALSELAVVVNGRPGWLVVYQTHAPATRRDWPTPLGSPRRDGTMACKRRKTVPCAKGPEMQRNFSAGATGSLSTSAEARFGFRDRVPRVACLPVPKPRVAPVRSIWTTTGVAFFSERASATRAPNNSLSK